MTKSLHVYICTSGYLCMQISRSLQKSLCMGANGLKHFLPGTISVALPLQLQWLCMLCQVAEMQASGMHASGMNPNAKVTSTV